MATYFKTQNLVWLLLLSLMTTSLCVAQRDVEQWKLQVSLGFNNPIDVVDDDEYYSEYVNFPSINIGVQHMFSENFGAKLDLGYNRSKSAEGSKDFKLNYTRINAQLVYDFKDVFTFLPAPIGVVGHAGPGVTMTAPLGADTNNTYAYPNFLGGLEVHYRLSESLSVFIDGSYALSLSGKRKYDPVVDGYSFNGDLMYVAVGVSLSLSGCNYCY
ncbi:outer membrane protein with beta-barrel domain [Gelidibacter sediminis]|uniref:Outer membrane protein with beta-barrel domain n=1 Tax=Gelidibacter sediminis TaxID=1608710 RepID=A0A4R7Q694_9FLAO|nr:outer membrane beta-barrel protein [Gelidibacter sediminis]TDU43107.1 outer membrane protein with beta-barrel domain [Gelidibacter sediminis]